MAATILRSTLPADLGSRVNLGSSD
jgi:hypothetical protein